MKRLRIAAGMVGAFAIVVCLTASSGRAAPPDMPAGEPRIDPAAPVVNDETQRETVGEFDVLPRVAGDTCGPGGCGVAAAFPVAGWWLEHRPVARVAGRSTRAAVRGTAAVLTWPWRRCRGGRCG